MFEKGYLTRSLDPREHYGLSKLGKDPPRLESISYAFEKPGIIRGLFR